MARGDNGARHGTRSMYVMGCRCEPCTVANADYQRDYMYAHYPSTKRLRPDFYKRKGGEALMPTYEVRRRTVMACAVVTAANETEARVLARDAFQQDAAIAALAADVTRQPHLEPYDQERDDRLDLPLPGDPSEAERPFAGDWRGL